MRNFKSISIIMASLLLFVFTVNPIGNNTAVKKDLKKYLDPSELETLVNEIGNGTRTDVVIIDVRPENVYNKAHIPTAINIPNGIITEDQSYLKDMDLVLYCETGGRVEMAKKNLIKKGFDKSRMLNFGGFSRYKGDTE